MLASLTLLAALLLAPAVPSADVVIDPEAALLVLSPARTLSMTGVGEVTFRDGRSEIVLEPGATVWLDGQPVTSRTTVSDGGRIQVTSPDGAVLWMIDVSGDADDVAAFTRPSADESASLLSALLAARGAHDAVDARELQALSELLLADGKGRQAAEALAAARDMEDVGTTHPDAASFLAEMLAATPPVVIGVSTRAPDASLAAHLGLDPKASLVIASVTEGYPAEAAGLAVHDVLLGADGSDGVTSASLREAIRSHAVGEPVRLTVRRGDEVFEVAIPVRQSEASAGGALSRASAIAAQREALADGAFAKLSRQNAVRAQLEASLAELGRAESSFDTARTFLQQQMAERRHSAATLSDEVASLEEELQGALEVGEVADSRVKLELLQREMASRQEQLDRLRAALSEAETGARQSASVLEQVLGQDDDRRRALADAKRASELLQRSLHERLSGMELLQQSMLVGPEGDGTARVQVLASPDESAERMARLEQRMAAIEELLQRMSRASDG